MSGVIEYLSLARLSSRTVECIEFNYENGVLSMIVLHFEGDTVLTVSAADIDCPLVTEIEGEKPERKRKRHIGYQCRVCCLMFGLGVKQCPNCGNFNRSRVYE